jgi:predicted nucleotidyltransferase
LAESFVTELNRLLQRLFDANVDFVIVGGFGAMLHGSSLVTRDLDVCAVLTPDNLEKLRSTFRDLHPTHRMTSQRISFLENPEPGTGLNNLYLQTDLGPLDLMSSITGVGDFSRVAAGSIEVELFGHRVRVIGLEDLILAKQALGREKDLLAVKELRAILEKSRRD